MVTINLPSGKYKLPTRLTLDQWKFLIGQELENPIFWSYILHKVTAAPLEELKRCHEEGLELGVSFLINSLTQRAIGQGYKNFEQINFGEWIDLDIWLVWGLDKHLTDITSILAPDVVYADEALYVIEQYAMWRLSLYRSYAVLFGLDGPQPLADDSITSDKLQIARGWYALIIKLAQGDILKIDEVTAQPLKKTLNLLAHNKNIALEERAQELQIKRSYDLQRNRR